MNTQYIVSYNEENKTFDTLSEAQSLVCWLVQDLSFDNHDMTAHRWANFLSGRTDDKMHQVMKEYNISITEVK